MKKFFLLYGNDLSSLDCRIKDVIKELLGLQSQINIEELKLEKKEDLELFFNKTINLQLFNETKILLVSIDEKIRKSLDDHVDEFISKINLNLENTHIIIKCYIEKYNKVLKNQISNSMVFKKLKQLGAIEEHEKIKFWEKEEMILQVQKLQEKYNLNFKKDALDVFVEIYANEFSSVNKDIHGELLKLQAYIAPENDVAKQDIEDLYSNGYTLEDLYLVLIDPTKRLDFKLVSDLNRMHPLYLVAFLQNRLRQALQLKIYADANINKYEISKLLGMNVYRIEKEMSQLKNIDVRDLKNKIKLLSDMEYKIKTGLVINNRLLDFLLPAVLACK